jgi:hypothetical protein
MVTICPGAGGRFTYRHARFEPWSTARRWDAPVSIFAVVEDGKGRRQARGEAMAESVGAANATGVAHRRFGIGWAVERNHAIWAVAALFAWAHTIDEMRIGEFVAVPFGAANAALVAAWPHLGRRAQAAVSIGFGLFWGLAAIPYHVIPLIAGATTWQNFSGLARIVAGVVMVALGVKIALGRGNRKSAEQAP